MNPRAEIWNIFHDGPITNIVEGGPGELGLTIGIEYLRSFFQGDGDSFTLRLLGCRLFEMTIWERDSHRTTDLAEIVAANPTILSTESLDCPVLVVTTTGELRMDFDDFRLELDDGTPVSYHQLCCACEAYWNRFHHQAADQQPPESNKAVSGKPEIPQN